MAPGKRTRGSGKRGSSVVSLLENDDAEHRRESRFRRQRRNSEDGKASLVKFVEWVWDREAEGMSCAIGNAISHWIEAVEILVVWIEGHYDLPAWSISILPDCRTDVVNTARIMLLEMPLHKRKSTNVMRDDSDKLVVSKGLRTIEKLKETRSALRKCTDSNEALPFNVPHGICFGKQCCNLTRLSVNDYKFGFTREQNQENY
ncbi:hypothetical protein RJT34_25770 [Clitoria ternatea]|uniref:Beta-galactosidase beta-sandwich domain-containing protein n=1 Tax=Clitoria ternatea TaxID=43366 RepID=A0AAN9IH52_CLITE